jgi:hypothetical protein
LRKLVEEARRSGGEEARRRKAQERTYAFMSAIAGNRENFEEATRALFTGNTRALRKLIAGWPGDIRKHIVRLLADTSSAA